MAEDMSVFINDVSDIVAEINYQINVRTLTFGKHYK